MKRITALLLVAVMTVAVMASCGASAPEFVKAENISVMNWASSPKTKKVIDTEEYRAAVAEAYNSVTETFPYEENAKSEYQLVMLSDADGTRSFLLQYLGGAEFNVSVSGEGDGVRYLVKNESLAKYIEDELITLKSVEAAVTVKFVRDAGVPAADGTVYDSAEELGEATVTVVGDELTPPMATDAVKAALEGGSVSDEYKINEGGRVTSVSSYEEKVAEIDGKVCFIHWAYTVNGTEIPTGEIVEATVADGAVVIVTYCASEIGA